MRKLLLIPFLFFALVGANSSNPDFESAGFRVCHAQYNFAVDGGGAFPATITPASNCTIPTNAIIFGCSINSTTAFAGTLNTTAVGLSAGGGSATSLLGVTTVATFTTNAKLQCVPVPQTASTWIKLTAPASIILTTATANLTAGVLEVYVFYFVSGT